MKRTQMAIVEATNIREFAEGFNKMMDRVAYFNHEEPVIDIKNFTAYVLYTDETKEEVKEETGERFFCSDCRHFHDNRKPNGCSDCPYRRGETKGADNVCKEFWDAYEAKEDILYVPRNRDGSVNKTTAKGKRYLKLKEQGMVI